MECLDAWCRCARAETAHVRGYGQELCAERGLPVLPHSRAARFCAGRTRCHTAPTTELAHAHTDAPTQHTYQHSTQTHTARLAAGVLLLLTTMFSTPVVAGAPHSSLHPTSPSQHLAAAAYPHNNRAEGGGASATLVASAERTVGEGAATASHKSEPEAQLCPQERPSSSHPLGAALEALRTSAAAKAGAALLGAFILVPVVSRLVSVLLGAARAFVQALLANRECVAVKMIQVVAVGPQAEVLQSRLQVSPCVCV